MSDFDRILNDACALLSDEDAQDNNWKPVAYELARRCATAEARVQMLSDLCDRWAQLCDMLLEGQRIEDADERRRELLGLNRLALSPDEEERDE